MDSSAFNGVGEFITSMILIGFVLAFVAGLIMPKFKGKSERYKAVDKYYELCLDKGYSKKVCDVRVADALIIDL